MRETFKQKIQNETPEMHAKRIEEAFADYQIDFSLNEGQLGAPLLDVGVHHGSFITFLRERLHNKGAYGVDYNEQKITGAGLIAADGGALPFADSTFDTVLARNYMTMFFPDKTADKMIEEMLRVTKNGGVVMFSASTYAENPDPDLQKLHAMSIEKGFGDPHQRSRDGYLHMEEHLASLERKGYIVTRRAYTPSKNRRG
jgi:ubiquinone/menaquinone biosynthesis C-methylase UbiE